MTDTTPIILCGSRTWRAYEPIYNEVARLLRRYATALLIRHGDEPKGADELIWQACEALNVRHIEYLAGRVRHTPHTGFQVVRASDWNFDGKAAGPIRNRVMRDAGAHGCVAFRMPGMSRGTDGMIELARERDIPVIVRSAV